MTPIPTIRAGVTLFRQNQIFISTGILQINLPVTYLQSNVFVTGKAFNFYTTQVSVLRNVPGPHESIGSSNLQWFTNYEPFDNPNYKTGLPGSTIACIVIGVLVFVAIIMALLWKNDLFIREKVKYIQQELIWNPRYI